MLRPTQETMNCVDVIRQTRESINSAAERTVNDSWDAEFDAS